MAFTAQPFASGSRGGNRFEALAGSNGDDDSGAQDDHQVDGEYEVVDGQQVLTELALVARKQERRRVTALPTGSMFTEKLRVYDEDNYVGNPVTRRYEGVDAPKLKAVSYTDPASNRTRKVVSREPSIVLMRDVGRDPRVELTFGGSIRVNDGWLFSSFLSQSQHPGIRLIVKRPGRADVTCDFFCNMIQRNDKGQVDLHFQWGTSKEVRNNIPRDCDELLNHVSNGRNDLLSIDFSTWKQDDNGRMQPMPFPPEPQKVSYTGISAAELERLNESWLAGETLSDADLFIVHVATYRDFTVYRYWPSGGHSAIKLYTEWFSAAMSMCAWYGNNWFYAAQAEEGEDIYAATTNIGEMQKPRWLAITNLVSINAWGSIVDAGVTETTASFAFVPSESAFPTPRVMAFAHRMAIIRNQVYQSRILRSSFKQEDWKIAGTFKSSSKLDGTYVVEMRVPDGALLNKDRALRPRIDTRIKIEVQAADFNTTGDTLMFQGSICDDHFNSGSEVVAAVRGPLLETSLPAFVSGRELKLIVQLVDDPTPSDRHLSTIEQIQQMWEHSKAGNPARTKGVDIPLVVLRASPTIVNTGSLALEISSEVLKLAESETVRLGLNAKQNYALGNTLTSRSGLTMIHGPPGCGKTWTLAAIMKIQSLVGRQLRKPRPIIAAASANEAVDNLMAQFLELLHKDKDHGDFLEIVRFKGSVLRGEKADVTMADSDDTAGDQDADEQPSTDAAIWDLIEQEHPTGEHDRHVEYGFHQKFMARIQIWAASQGVKDAEHRNAADAVKYLDLVQKVKSNTGDPAQRKLNRVEKRELEEELALYYLSNVVDVVFATNSMSAHQLLRVGFNPRILISDEAAVTALADCATPMAVFGDTLELIVPAGDHQQQQPVVASKGGNEYAEVLKISLFESVIQANALEDFSVALQEQYRMHPELREMPSRMFYKSIGGLTDAPQVSVVTPLWITWKAFMEHTFGPAWNGRHRVVFDVSGSTKLTAADGTTVTVPIQSTQNKGTSWVNQSEAEAIRDIIGLAIRFTPPPNGRKIEPKDFLILSGYSEQCHLINTLLFQAQINTPGSLVKVASLRGIQGGQGEIVGFSMVRNTPNQPLDIGFNGDPHGLNVAFTRPKQVWMGFGNFQAWTEKAIKGVPIMKGNGKLRDFAEVVSDIWGGYKDLVAYSDFRDAMSGRRPTASTIKTLIKEKPQDPSGKPQSHGKQKETSLFGQREQQARQQARQQEQRAKNLLGADAGAGVQKKKSRRSRKKKTGKTPAEDDAAGSGEDGEDEEPKVANDAAPGAPGGGAAGGAADAAPGASGGGADGGGADAAPGAPGAVAESGGAVDDTMVE